MICKFQETIKDILPSIFNAKMPSCAVFKCTNTNRKTKGTDIKYYSFPSNKDLAKIWINACHREDSINLKNGKN